MKRWALLLMFALIAFAVAGADTDAEATDSGAGFRLQPQAGVQAGLNEFFGTAGVRADYYFGRVVGIGLGAQGTYGFKYGDAFVNVFGMLDLGPFYIGPGVSFMLDPGASADENLAVAGQTVNIAATAGFMLPFVRLGPGRLGVDLGLDWYVSSFPIESTSDNWLGDIISGLFQAVAQVILSAKLDVNVMYSISFQFRD